MPVNPDPFMLSLFAIGLMLLTIIGGSIPLWSKNWSERRMNSLLTFSGSFLLGITILHLIPETVSTGNSWSGVLILFGFFLQQAIQRFTHGIEHGHTHIAHHNHQHSVSLLPVIIGLSFHAFSEGLPLGVHYAEQMTLPSLYLAVSLHKLPEAMLVTSLVYSRKHQKRGAWISLLLFSTITPIAALLTHYLGTQYSSIHTLVEWCIPIITGSFIHISTTIFFESGTRSHDMNWKKWLLIILGIGLACTTLVGGVQQHVH